MRTATGLTLIALGAILAFAVNGHPSWLNIQVIGWVVIATGLAGMLIPGSRYAAVRSRIVRQRPGPGGTITEVDERRYPPYIRLNPASAMTGDPANLVASKDDIKAELEKESGDEETVEEYLDS
ncbi:MAG TPA: DUF6458 family protein [Streptosporangiaceae bacterium]|nr:DUF6458 family protein [Streptosporangiaceae bacterium]